MPAGRPTAYSKDICATVHNLCLLQLTEHQIADTLGINRETLTKWKKKHPELANAIREGKDIADGKVAKSLAERALGYSHPEEKIFCHQGVVTRVETTKHYPPDTSAASLWLRNRQPDRWRDQKEIAGKLTLDAILEDLADE